MNFIFAMALQNKNEKVQKILFKLTRKHFLNKFYCDRIVTLMETQVFIVDYKDWIRKAKIKKRTNFVDWIINWCVFNDLQLFNKDMSP